MEKKWRSSLLILSLLINFKPQQVQGSEKPQFSESQYLIAFLFASFAVNYLGLILNYRDVDFSSLDSEEGCFSFLDDDNSSDLEEELPLIQNNHRFFPAHLGHSIPQDASAILLNLDKDKQKEISKQLKDAPELGKGRFSCVKKIEIDGKKFAVKVPLNKASYKIFAAEQEVLKKLNHPNCIIFLGSIPSRRMNLLFEYCEADLKDFLEKKVNITWQNYFNLLGGILSALEYLHEQNPQIIHHDVKSQNVLIDKWGNSKLSDFGLAIITPKDWDRDNPSLKQKRGTLRFVAPEILRDEPHGEKVDIYSFGVLLFSVTRRDHGGDSTPKMVLIFQKDMEGLQNLINSCLVSYPAARPRAKNLINRWNSVLNELKDRNFDFSGDVWED